MGGDRAVVVGGRKLVDEFVVVRLAHTGFRVRLRQLAAADNARTRSGFRSVLVLEPVLPLSMSVLGERDPCFLVEDARPPPRG